MPNDTRQPLMGVTSSNSTASYAIHTHRDRARDMDARTDTSGLQGEPDHLWVSGFVLELLCLLPHSSRLWVLAMHKQ